MSEKWYLAGKEFFFYTMRAPFFGGGRGDWGEQDETVAVLEGGTRSGGAVYGAFP